MATIQQLPARPAPIPGTSATFPGTTAAAVPRPSVLRPPSSVHSASVPIVPRQPRAAAPTSPEPPSSLRALEQLSQSVANGLLGLPDLRQQTLEALAAEGMEPDAVAALDLSDPATQARLAPILATLKSSALTQIESFWSGFIDGRGFPRAEQFPAFLRDSLREELALKIQDKDLHPDDRVLLNSALDSGYSTAPLLYQLNLKDNTLAGAFVIADAGSGRHLLYVPGRGLEGFASRQQLLRTLPTYLEDPTERDSLLAALPVAMQADAADLGNSLEPEHVWSLTTLEPPLLKQAVEAQRHKQRMDIDTAFALPVAGQPASSPAQWLETLQQAVDQPGQFGNEAMLARRDGDLLKRAAKRLLPEWYKNAGPEALAQQARLLENWQASRAGLSQQLGAAESPAAYLRQVMDQALKADLAISLDPDQLRISTLRALPAGGGQYPQSRSLTELGVSGLFAGDEQPGSDFLHNSTLTYKGRPLDSTLVDLTPAYLVTLINKLPPPAQVRTALTEVFTANRLMAMNQVVDSRLVSLAYSAQLRGDITPLDGQAIEKLSQSSYSATPPGIQVNLLKLDGKTLLKDVLVVRHGQGPQQRWLVYTPGAPRELQWQGFSNAKELSEEVASWSRNPDMSQWLLQQANPGNRTALQARLTGMAEKPSQVSEFVTLQKQGSYNHATSALVDANLVQLQADLKTSIPDWYAQASEPQRQKLNRLNGDLGAWAEHVRSTRPPQQSFDEYLHDAADGKINALLGRPKGSVDPAQIIVITPRGTLTFTQMMRNGYDDSLGLLTPTADTTARFRGPPGLDLSSLTAQKVAASVRGQWIGDRYIADLQKRFVNPANPSYKPNQLNRLIETKLLLQQAATVSALKHQITPEQQQWLLKSLATLDDPSNSQRNRLALAPLTIDIPIGVPNRFASTSTELEAIDGVYVLTRPDAVGTPQRLIYTPDAPDGVLFRDYADFNNSLHNPALADYYQQRASAGAQIKIARRIKVFQAGQGKLPEPGPLDHQGLLKLVYDAPLLRQIENVQETTLGRQQMLSKLVLDSLELIVTGLSAPAVFPSLAMGAALSLKDLGLASLAAQEGNHDKVIEHAYGAVFNMVGAALDVSGLLGLSKLAAKPTAHVPVSLNLDQTLKTLDQLSPVAPPGMREVALNGERFLVNQNPNVMGHFELYRQGPNGDLTSAGAFARKGVDGKWARLGLKGGNDGVPSTHVLHDIRTEFGNSNEILVTYSTDLGGYTTQVKFDFDVNAWRTVSDNQAIRFDPKTRKMERIREKDLVPASDEVKNKAMRDLGLDISLPLSVTPLDRSGFKPIPRNISSIWIGNEMPLEHIKNVGNNARIAARNDPPLEMTLYLSIADATERAKTLEHLKNHAPELKIEMLEDTDFYKGFKTTKYHEQYLAESTGPAINYAAAVDTLRIQLVNHKGGMFVDADDAFPVLAEGLSIFPKESLDVGEGSLLLADLISSQRLKMNHQFGNSVLGSLPNNPTLKAMSEESFTRFQKNRDLFEKRPYKNTHSSAQLDAYIQRISEVTGPGLLNDIIQKHMPDVYKYSALHRFVFDEFHISASQKLALRANLQDFSNSYKHLNIDLGSAHSWEHTR